MSEAVQTPGGAEGPAPRYESDFSYRKIKLATIILIAQMFATSLLPFMALTFVNVPLTKEFGWTQTEFSWATSFLMWFGASTTPIYGRIVDRVGVRPLILFGTVGVGLSTLSLAYLHGSLLQFYFSFALLGVFGSSAIGYSKIISALFTQHRGKALALIGIESTLAAAGIPPLVNWLIEDYGWRTLFAVCAVIILAIVPILYFTIDEPGEINSDRRLFRKKDGAALAARKKADETLEGLTVPEVLRNKVYWTIVIATIIGSAPRSGMVPFLVPMLAEKGFSTSDTALYISMMTLIAPFGTLAGGYCVDKIQNAKIAAPFQVISLIGLFLFALVSASFGGWYLLVLSVGFTGFAFGTTRPIGAYLHIRFFGLKAFGFYYGLEMSLLAFSMGFAPPIIAYMRDESGSYESGYILMVASLAVGAAAYFFLPKYRYAANIGAVPLDEPPADGAATSGDDAAARLAKTAPATS